MKICVIGAGAIGTALGNVMASKKRNHVTLWSIEEDVVLDINDTHYNHKYFPGISLNKRLTATDDKASFTDVDIIFLAIPSSVILQFIKENKERVSPNTLIINLAKGFGHNKETLVESIQSFFPNNPVGTLKGPSFARGLVNNIPTAFTFGIEDKAYFKVIKKVFKKTIVHLDYTTEVRSVELLSVLKNIYAVSMGIVDAHFDSPNLRFLFFTKAFQEMRDVLIGLGGKEKLLFYYCGIGDFGLTTQNDLSRNRTFGLLIGKGFFTKESMSNVVLEGRIATEVFYHKMCNLEEDEVKYPIIKELYQVFEGKNNISKFVYRVIR